MIRDAKLAIRNLGLILVGGKLGHSHTSSTSKGGREKAHVDNGAPIIRTKLLNERRKRWPIGIVSFNSVPLSVLPGLSTTQRQLLVAGF